MVPVSLLSVSSLWPCHRWDALTNGPATLGHFTFEKELAHKASIWCKNHHTSNRPANRPPLDKALDHLLGNFNVFASDPALL